MGWLMIVGMLVCGRERRGDDRPAIAAGQRV